MDVGDLLAGDERQEHGGRLLTHPPDGYVAIVVVAFADLRHAGGDGAAVFLVNRSQEEEAEITVDVAALGVGTVDEAWTLSDPDPHAVSSIDQQHRVGLRPAAGAAVADGALRVTLPPVSWTAVSLR